MWIYLIFLDFLHAIHIIPEHVLTDMKNSKGLDIQISFQRYQGTLFHKNKNINPYGDGTSQIQPIWPILADFYAFVSLYNQP